MAHIPHWHFYLDQLLKKLLKHNNRASLRAKWNKNWGTQLSTNPRGRTTESRYVFALAVSSAKENTECVQCRLSPVPTSTLRPPWQNSGSCLPWFRCHANCADPDMFDVSTIYIYIHLITLQAICVWVQKSLLCEFIFKYLFYSKMI